MGEVLSADIVTDKTLNIVPNRTTIFSIYKMFPTPLFRGVEPHDAKTPLNEPAFAAIY